MKKSFAKELGKGLLVWVVIWVVILIGSAIQYS